MKRATVIYHYESEGWWAESPEYPDYGAAGASLSDVQVLVREGLPWHVGAPVEICDGLQGIATGVTVSSRVKEMPATKAFVGQGWRKLTPSTMPTTEICRAAA